MSIKCKSTFTIKRLWIILLTVLPFVGYHLEILISVLADHQLNNDVEYATAELSAGTIKGRVSYEAGRNRPVNVFEGIPFAEPPLGNRRWKQLKPKMPWKGALETTKYAPACMYNVTFTLSIRPNMSEDCMYLNIFADPRCKTLQKPCPILFYIYGGAFRFGSTQFNEAQIVQKYASDGVIFVAAAYRTGIFGFLDLDNEDAVKKNLAIYDILFALRWTKREIPGSFGGDPNRITIMGNSAGGNAVLILCTSPLVKKEDFHRAIVSSGDLCLPRSPDLKSSFVVAHHFKCTSKNAREILRCLRRIPASEILQASKDLELLPDGHGRSLSFKGPSPDGLLIPGNAIEILKYWKNRPMILSTTRQEFTVSEDDTEEGQCSETLSAFALETSAVMDACIQRFHSQWKIGEPMGANYEKYHAAAVLLASINRLKGSPSYVASIEIANYSRHADDMYFFFGLHYKPADVPAVKLMDIYYPSMIKRFVKTGEPDEAWESADELGRGYFVLDFVVRDNGTLAKWPHFVPGNYSDPGAVEFWLEEMPILERNSTTLARSFHNFPTSSAKYLEKYIESKRIPRKRRNWWTYNNINNPIIGMLVTNTSPEDVKTNHVHMNPDAHSLSSEARNQSILNELDRVWNAFWIAICITLILSLAFLLLLLSTSFRRWRMLNRRGYIQIGYEEKSSAINKTFSTASTVRVMSQ